MIERECETKRTSMVWHGNQRLTIEKSFKSFLFELCVTINTMHNILQNHSLHMEEYIENHYLPILW